MKQRNINLFQITAYFSNSKDPYPETFYLVADDEKDVLEYLKENKAFNTKITKTIITYIYNQSHI